MSEKFQCGDTTELVGYLYDECEPAARTAIAAHVKVCGPCAAELSALRSTREQLAAWSPPDAELGFGPLLFNLPLFLFFFSDDMRHVAPVTAALLVTALPPLLEAGFHRALIVHKATAVVVAAGFLLAWPLAHWADRALIAFDALRYATPFLDPEPFAWYLR